MMVKKTTLSPLPKPYPMLHWKEAEGSSTAIKSMSTGTSWENKQRPGHRDRQSRSRRQSRANMGRGTGTDREQGGREEDRTDTSTDKRLPEPVEAQC
jgi:hypothetical protein